MMNDDELRKLNAIVGSAIKALAESGADDALVGSFAASHRAKVAQILGHSEKSTEAPDLLSLVTQAVGAALANAGVLAKQGRPRSTRRVYVNVAGRRTSLTLRAESMDKLAESTGGSKQASAAIQSLASSAPVDVANRSRWVEERLPGLIASAAGEHSSARH